jgi:4-amino-4-deoxy-L-arabinose transferase-like glycosyltransferase
MEFQRCSYSMISFARLNYLLRPQLFVVAAFIAMLAVSWRRWTSMIVDIGRETDLPLRLMNGELLYRDVHYLYPPFSPYLNALLYKVFGGHLDTLAFSGIVFTALLIFICYKIARKLMPPVGASIAAALIAIMSFKPAGSLVLPYSFAGLHAAVFALAAVLFTLRYAENRKRADLVITGIFIGLAAITKQEFAFAAAVAVSAYSIYLHRTDFRLILRDISLAAIPALAIAVPVFGLLFAAIDWRILINDCHLFYTNIPESLNFYNRFRSGLNDPLGSFVQMIGAAAISTAFVVVIVFFSDRRGKSRARLAYWFAGSAAVAVPILYLYRDQWDGSPLRALPFFLMAIIVYTWSRRTGDSNADADDLEGRASPHFLFIVAVFSLALIFRVLLRVPSGGFSGSFYVPPSLILLIYALLTALPLAVKKWSGDENSYSRAVAITRAFCILAIIGTAISFSFRYRARFGYEISAHRGTLVAERGSGPTIDAALKFIEANTSENEVITVLPEGSDLAFLTGRRINLRHQVLIPGFLGEQDEKDAIEALKKANVRYIFITNRPMREFGATAFGEDFYTTFGGFINENYETVAAFGSPGDPDPKIGGPQFFIKVLKRNEP